MLFRSATAKELIEKIDIELEKYVAPVPKKSMTMKERIDKAKTKLSEKNHKKLKKILNKATEQAQHAREVD